MWIKLWITSCCAGIALAAIQEPYFLLSTGDNLVRASIDFNEMENVTTESGPHMDYDHNDKLLFYKHGNNIRRCTLAGADTQTVISGIPDITGLAVDYDAKRIYWAQYEAYDKTSIKSCKYDGSDVRMVLQAQTCVATNAKMSCKITSIAVDVKAKALYWSEMRHRNSEKTLYDMFFKKAGLDGSNAATVTEFNIHKDGPGYISCNVQNKKCFLRVYDYGGLRAVDMDTGIEYQVPETPFFTVSVTWNAFVSHGGLLYTTFNRREQTTPYRMELSGYGITNMTDAFPGITDYMIIVDASTRAARTKPFLEFTLDSQDNTEFVCWMPESGAASFVVNWVSGSETLKADVPVTTAKTVLKLSSVDVNRLQTQLSCQTKESTAAVQTSNVIAVPGYVRVHPRSLTILEGESADIQIQVNLPMRFFQAQRLLIGLHNKYKSEEDLDESDVLVKQRPAATWASAPALQNKLIVDDNNWQDSHTLTFKAMEDGIHTGTKSRESVLLVGRLVPEADNFQTLDTENGLFYGRNFGDLMIPLKVTVEDRDTDNSCGAFNTARMRTTDGVYFNHQYEGEFVFYKHISADYQANLLLASCPGSAACVCAVAARADDEVIVLDKCPRATSATSYSDTWTSSPAINEYRLQFGNETIGSDWWKVRERDKFSRAAQVKKSNLSLMKYGNKDNTYQIDFPHRGKLFVTVNAIGSLHVFYKPSVADYGKSSGLCGFYDRDDTNDLKLRDGTVVTDLSADTSSQFSQGWRASTGEQLFAGVAESAATAPQAYCYLKQDYYGFWGHGHECLVNAERLEHRPNQDVRDLSAYLVTYKPKPGTSLTASSRRKRSLSQATEFSPFAMFAVDSAYQPQTVSWPNQGLTEAQAHQKCSDALTADAGAQACAKVMGSTLNKDKMISACTQDIGLSIAWEKSTKNTIQALLETCVDFLKSLDDGGESLPAPPGGVTRNELQQAVCPAYCRRGVCAEGETDEYIGVCKCTDGKPIYIPTCYPENQSERSITSLYNRGLCDVKERRCDVLVFKGKIFPSFTLYSSKAYPVFVTPRPSPKEGLGTYIDGETLALETPGYSGPYSLDIDFLEGGKGRYFIVYNSMCMTCHATTTGFDCSVKSDYCVTKDDWVNCRDSTTVTNKTKYFCENDVITNPVKPTENPGDRGPPGGQEGNNDVAIGVGVTVAVLVVLAAVAALVWYLQKQRSAGVRGVNGMGMASPHSKQLGQDNMAMA